MMVIEGLRPVMGMREISRISGLPLSTYYYKPRRRNVTRLDPAIEERIVDTASERTTYGYRRIWAILRNSGIHVNVKTVRRTLKRNNLALPARRHKGRTKTRNLFRPDEFEKRWSSNENFRKEFLEERRRKEEKRLRNRNNGKRRLKENVSYENGITVQN